MQDSQPFESAQQEGDGYRIELKVRDWDGPVELSDRPLWHHLHLNLPPVEFRGAMFAPELGHDDTWDVGHSFFRPAGVLLASQGTGGRAFSVVCALDPGFFATATDTEFKWSADILRRCCDLDASPLPPLLARIAQELRFPQKGQRAILESLAWQAAVETARYLSRAEIAGESGRLSSEQLGRIEARLNTEELSPPTVGELAQLLSMSERHLLRLFRATTGGTVRAHIRSRLMDRARTGLTEGRPIKQIAYELGFSGPASFTSAFRSITGQSPSKWRDNNGA